MAFIMLWLLAAAPGLLFITGVMFALCLPWLSPLASLVVCTSAALVMALAWVWVLPSILYGRLLGGLGLVNDASLERSWMRAFDGASEQPPLVDLWRIESPNPLLLVLGLPLRRPVLAVSSGWLFAHGEEGFRKACIRAVARIQHPGLGLWTCGAVVICALQVGLSRSFSLAMLAPPSDQGGTLRLSASRAAFSLPVFSWIAWIRGVLRLEPLSYADEPNGVRNGDDFEQGTIEWAVTRQLLSLDSGAVVRPAQKSILSWFPGHW